MRQVPIKSLTRSLATAFVLLGVVPAWSQAPVPIPTVAEAVPVPQGWLLSYDDEFNGTAVNPTFWDISDWPAQGNLGVQYWSPDDVSIQNGYLRLAYEKRKLKTWDYTAGEINSTNRMGFLYGRVEIRAKMPAGSGAWVRDGLSALSDSWPPSVDVLEYFGNRPGSMQFGNFWEDQNGKQQQALNNSPILGSGPTEWHTYTLNWTPGDLSWYIDGVLSAEQQFHVPSEPMNLGLSGSIGSYAGDPAAGSWPQEQDIDYVRIYRLAGLPPPVQAGRDQETQLATALAKGKPATIGATVTLNGSTCSPQGDVKTLWSVVSGAGDVVIDDPTNVQTKAHFKVVGTYVLELKASHGADFATDTTKVIVDSSAALVLPATADTDIGYLVSDATAAAHNWGSSHEMWVYSGATQSGPLGTDWTLLRFDISKIKTVSKASLRLTGGMEHAAEPYTIDCVVSDVPTSTWDENKVTWNSKPELGEQIATFEVKPYLYNNQFRTNDIDLATYVQKELKAGITSINIAISSIPFVGQTICKFRSRESDYGKPEIVVSPVP